MTIDQGNDTTRRRARQRASSASRFDSAHATTTEGITNERTRIVGNRTGFLADAVIAVVRLFRAVSQVLAGWIRRAAAVVTPLGGVMLIVVPVALGFGYGFSLSSWSPSGGPGWC